MRPLAIVLLLAVAGAPPLVAQIKLSAPLADLEAAAQRDSNDAAAQYNVGVGYFASHRYADAETALRHALAIEPRFADAWLALSIIRDNDDNFWKQLRKEKGDSAVRLAQREYGSYYRRAFLINPLVDMRILAPTIRIYGTGDFLKGYKALIEGRYDEAHERLAKAVDYYDAALGARGSDWLMWLSAMAAARADKPAVAMAELDSLIVHVDARAGKADSTGFEELDGVEMRQVLAALKQRAGQDDEAVSIYHDVLARDVGNYMAHVQLANIYEARRDYARAIVERQRAMDTNPDDASLLLDSGITLGKAGRYADAARQLATAVERNAHDTRALFWLGVAQQQAGDKEAARAAYTRFVAAAPSRFDHQIQQARQYLGELQ
jgi:Tfp pilus assembly protein PilF